MNLSLPASVVSSSPSETENCGASLANLLLNTPSLPRFIALYGDLGVGKTAFIRGFASVAAPTSAVRSPTFAIVKEYQSGSVPVFHFDMYRISDEDDLYSVGYFDYLKKDGFILCEWSENIPYAIPDEYIIVTIRKTDGETGRSICMETITSTNEKNKNRKDILR